MEETQSLGRGKQRWWGEAWGRMRQAWEHSSDYRWGYNVRHSKASQLLHGGHQGTGKEDDPSSPNSSLDTNCQVLVIEWLGVFWHRQSTRTQRRKQAGRHSYPQMNSLQSLSNLQVFTQVPLLACQERVVSFVLHKLTTWDTATQYFQFPAGKYFPQTSILKKQ